MAKASIDELERQESTIVETLRQRGHRMTTPRRLLIRSLLEAGGHRTAEELVTEVQSGAPDIHRSTIYRNLEELERLGVIEHAHIGHGAASYHLALIPHGHLVCSSCGRTIEVPDEFFAPLAHRAMSEHDFRIDPHHLALLGRCSSCGTEPTGL